MPSKIQLKELNYDYALKINDFWLRDWADQYSMPNQKTSIVDAVAVSVSESGDTPIAYGQVKLFPELMLFCDMEAPKRNRVEALKQLMVEAFRGIEAAGLEECYCLIKDMKFARLIAKKYGFTIIDNPGVLLIRKV